MYNSGAWIRTWRPTFSLEENFARPEMDPEIALAVAEGNNLKLFVGMKAPPSDQENPPGPADLPGIWRFLWGVTWGVEIQPKDFDALSKDRRITSIRLNRGI